MSVRSTVAVFLWLALCLSTILAADRDAVDRGMLIDALQMRIRYHLEKQASTFFSAGSFTFAASGSFTVGNSSSSVPQSCGLEETRQDKTSYRAVYSPYVKYLGATFAANDCSPSAGQEAEDEVLRGRYYVSKSELEVAITHFNKALQLDSKCAKAYVARGELHLAKGDHQKAMQDFSRAVELSPTSAAAHAALGRRHVAGKQWRMAIAELTRAVRLDHVDYSAYAARAFAYFNLGDREKAFADHDAALRLSAWEHDQIVAAGVPFIERHAALVEKIKRELPNKPHVPIDIDSTMESGARQRQRALERLYPRTAPPRAEQP
jgi:tetratricopeptide (TPR) repeat protein